MTELKQLRVDQQCPMCVVEASRSETNLFELQIYMTWHKLLPLLYCCVGLRIRRKY